MSKQNQTGPVRLADKLDGQRVVVSFRLSNGMVVSLSDPTIAHLEQVADLDTINPVQQVVKTSEILEFDPPISTLSARLLEEVTAILEQLFPRKARQDKDPV